MAGKNLYFEGTILNVREASVDELVRQHYIPGS
jgi:FKBP-type peptidyl-prolyl cis-trans isomerase 2